MPIIHATFSTPLLATLAAVLASIAIIATALLLIASAWDQWIHGEHAWVANNPSRTPSICSGESNAPS
jgi:hypothetical protein